MGYVVWHDFGSEGWLPSDEPLESLDEVWGYLQTNPHRTQPFRVTREVNARLIDLDAPMLAPDPYAGTVRAPDAFTQTVKRHTEPERKPPF